jgi:hypothetical protein
MHHQAQNKVLEPNYLLLFPAPRIGGRLAVLEIS